MRITASLQNTKQERFVGKTKDAPYWSKVLWTKNRKASLELILGGMLHTSEGQELHVLVPKTPEYEDFSMDGVLVEYYPLNEKLDPDWQVLKESYKEAPVDVFVFPHLFGVYHDANRGKTFCKQKEAILIEDASHCLYDYQKVGAVGDFVLFGDPTLLPTKEGAWIVVNHEEEERVAAIVADMKEHLADAAYAIAPSAQQIIQRYSYENLKEIAYVRRENCGLLQFYMKQLDWKTISMIPADCEAPYLAVFALGEGVDRAQIEQHLQTAGIPVLEPMEGYLGLPVHHGIAPQELAKRMGDVVSLTKPQVTVEEITEAGSKRWADLYHRILITNIPQHWAYGDIKERAEGWHVQRFLFTREGKDIGLVQVLSKRVLGIPVAYRVNRGPIFLPEEQSMDLELAAVTQLRKKLRHPSIFFYVPYSVMTEENYVKMALAKWKNWDIFGYPTGVIDLERSEEEIRKSLNSKWRNQLKTSEKYGNEVLTDKNRFDEMLRYYDEEQQEKGFKGENPNLLKEMQAHEAQPFRFFYVENEAGELLAFDIFYRHDTVATYFIGWNSEEGRKQCLNNLLLYQAAIHLKAEGVATMDLGGIEYIHTEAVAKFKDGMMPQHFRQMGEFIKIG